MRFDIMHCESLFFSSILYKTYIVFMYKAHYTSLHNR